MRVRESGQDPRFRLRAYRPSASGMPILRFVSWRVAGDG